MVVASSVSGPMVISATMDPHFVSNDRSLCISNDRIRLESLSTKLGTWYLYSEVDSSSSSNPVRLCEKS